MNKQKQGYDKKELLAAKNHWQELRHDKRKRRDARALKRDSWEKQA